MAKNPARAPLRVCIWDKKVEISIGIETLAHAFEAIPDPVAPLRVTDYKAFAQDVVRELVNEQEDGTTPVHELLDRATEAAADQGSEAVEVVKVTKGKE